MDFFDTQTAPSGYHSRWAPFALDLEFFLVVLLVLSLVLTLVLDGILVFLVAGLGVIAGIVLFVFQKAHLFSLNIVLPECEWVYTKNVPIITIFGIPNLVVLCYNGHKKAWQEALYHEMSVLQPLGE